MIDEQYSYGGGTIGKQQLTKIAETNNMSFQELLDNNPDVKKEEGVSQQELSEARFNINNKEYDMNDIFKLAKMEDSSVEDFLKKHKDKIETTSRIGDIFSLSKPKNGKPKELKHIEFEDLQKVDGKKGTWYDELFTSEKDVFANLKDHYSKDHNVRFEQVGGNRDKIWAKNQAGQTQVFELPSSWNRYRVGSVSSVIAPIIGEKDVGTWEDFYKNITNFIEEGNKNIDPVLAKQQKDARKFLDKQITTERIKEIIPDFTGNFEAMNIDDDKEKKDLTKALKKEFADDKRWSKLDEEDIEFAIDDIIKLKADEQAIAKLDIKKKLKDQYLPTDAARSEIHKNGEENEKDKFNKTEAKLHGYFNEYEKLIGLDDEESKKKRKDLKGLMDIERNNLTTWFNGKSMFVLDKNGNYVDDARKGKSQDQMFITEEEMQDRKNTLQDKIGGRRDGVRHASNMNFEDIYVSDQEGEEMHNVVVNNASVYTSLIRDYNIKPHDKTKNGHVFRVPKHILADNYNYMIKGDGYDMHKDYFAEDVGDRRSTFMEANPGQFDTPDGYFGLLEHDDKQDLSWIEKNLGGTRLGPAVGSLWDTDEYSDVDLSKEFKRELKGWRDDRKKLMADRKILNDMHLLNIDPGSNTLSLKADLNPFAEGKSDISLDFIPRGTEMLYEGFGHALGFDSNAQEDINVWSTRTANDVLEQFAESSPDFELNDEQKDRVQRSGAYKVFEGVTGFVPAITEFALIDVALKKVGAVTGIPRLINNITRSYSMGTKGSAVGARAVAKEIGYTGNFKSPQFKKAIENYNNLTKAGRAAPIITNAPKFFSVNNGLHHGYKILHEEAKMRIAFEDDYKLGMGAGFYIAGASLPRFSFDRKSIFGKHANWMNSGLTLGRSGVAGALGSATATQLEALIEDVRGHTTYGKFLKDEYDNIGSELGQQGLIDFFTFALVSRGKGINRYGFTGTKRLEALHEDAYKQIKILNAAKHPNMSPKAKAEWLQQYQKYTDLYSGVGERLNILDRNAKWADPEQRKKIVTKQTRNAELVFNRIKGYEDWKFEGQDNNKEFENKDALAEFDKTNKKIRLDLSKIDEGSLPHEIGHMTLKALFNSNPEISKAFAREIRSSFKGSLGRFEVKEVKDGKLVGTGREKDMTLEEHIKNEYQDRGDYNKIKSEEFVAYAIELLAQPKHYSVLVDNGSFTNLKQNINRLYNQKVGEDIFKQQDSKKELINFLANFGTSVQKGALTLKQLERFEKFGLKLAGKEGIDVTSLYKEPISKDSRTESEKATATKGVKEKRDLIENIYKTRIAGLSGDKKRQAVMDWLIGGKNASKKKSPEIYEAEIRRQHPKANDAKIKELVEEGPDRLRTEGHFNAIAMRAIDLKIKEGKLNDMSFTEKKTLIRDLLLDPLKVKAEKTKKDIKKRGVLDVIMDYKPGLNKDLASWVMGNLMGAPETGGYSRIHEIEKRGRERLELGDLHRKSIGREEGQVRESELGITTQEQQAMPGPKYIGEQIVIAKDLGASATAIEGVKRVAAEFLEQAKLKDLTYNEIGDALMDVTRPIVERALGRDAEFYAELERGDKNKSDKYKNIMKDTRTVLFDKAKTLYESIPLQMSEMIGKITGAMKTFGTLYDATGMRVKYKYLPDWMGLTPKQKAEGPHIFTKKPFGETKEGKTAFLNFMYNNPITGKKLTNAQLNTRVERLIDFTSMSMANQALRELIEPGSRYRDMILSKEGLEKMFDRTSENMRFIEQQKQVDRIIEQIRDALPKALATKGTKEVKPYLDFAKEFNKYPKITEEIIEKIFYENYKFISRVNMNSWIKNILNPLGFGKKLDPKVFNPPEIIADPKKANTVSIEQIKGWKEFPTILKKLGVDESIIKGIETKYSKHYKSPEFFEDYYGGFVKHVASKLPESFINSTAFKAMAGQGTLKWEGFELIDREIVETGKPFTVKKDGSGKSAVLDVAQWEMIKKKYNIKGKPDKSFSKKEQEAFKNWKFTDTGTLKKFIAKTYKTPKYDTYGKRTESVETMLELKELFQKRLGLDKGAEAANQEVLEVIDIATRDYMNTAKNKGAVANQLLFHYAIQTNISNAPHRSSATHMDITLENIREGKEGYGEHYLQLLNRNANTFIDILRHGKNDKAFLESYRELADMYRQGIILKTTQEGLDYKMVDGKRVKVSTEIPEYLTRDMGAWSTALPSMKMANNQLYLGEGFLTRGHQVLYNIAAGTVGKVTAQTNVLPTKGIGKKQMIENLRTVDKAIGLGRIKDKKKKGMSAWDFDDTLARTKSGVRYTLPNPSGKPAPGRKVIFMAGGPGSGKSTVIKGLGLEKQGFKIVNQDISLEWLMKNHGLPTDMKDFTPEQASKFSSLGWDARMIAKHKQTKFQGKGDGIIVDGTGNSLNVMRNQVQQFKNKGYDVQMMFVETSLETALQRNQARKERSLRDGIVKRTHESVQNNKEAFRKLFGNNFAEVKTDNLKIGDAVPKDVIGKMDGFTKGYIKGRLDAGEYAHKGADIEAQGGKFDFTEFDYVKEGEKGPLFGKAMERAKKYGVKDQFIITARPHAAKMPIFRFLQARGLDIPFDNIITLENSSAKAKAMFMLEKFKEGYNDMYFADDAMQNVKAVKEVLDQLDIKSKVQQALPTKGVLNVNINNIMEHSLGVESGKRFSKAEGKIRGKDIKRRRVFMPDSAADLELLLEPLYGKGNKGKESKKWFEDNFYKPWERGINDLNTARQTILNDYMSLRKQNKDVVKSLDKEVEGTNFTNDQAARVYLWDKAGFEVPGLTKTSKAKLIEHVISNPRLHAFAENIGVLTKIETGLKKPGTEWWAGTLASEVSETGRTVDRKKYINDWIEAKNEIFSEENMNKMESRLGTRWRDAIEDMFDRMETGRTRSEKMGRIGNKLMNYLNGSVGAIMNLNMRSATLQLISSVNFINHAENNPLAAAKAFANFPQYCKDFMTIMNSDMLKQRRQGLKINVTEAELAAAAEGEGNKAKKMLSWILSKGYLPTKIADSFAIAAGGSTYLRNRIKMYEKQGLETKEAEKKAWVDFQGIAEKTQQSSRADLLSQQQTSFAGRIVLPFANTPMQMNRIMMKELLDISNSRFDGFVGENSLTNKLSKVTYYGAVQSLIFAGLQSAAFALMANSDDDELIADKKVRTINTATDSFMRGMGIQGAVLAGVKNAILMAIKQSEKGYRADYGEVAEALLNISPTIGSKYSKMDGAGNTYKYNEKEIKEKGLSLDNTKAIEASAQVVEAITNVPVHRVVRKTQNVNAALDENNEAWQRLLNALGWSPWDVGVAQEKKRKEKEKKAKLKFLYKNRKRKPIRKRKTRKVRTR
mgnify:CR=1 FL=1